MNVLLITYTKASTKEMQKAPGVFLRFDFVVMDMNLLTVIDRGKRCGVMATNANVEEAFLQDIKEIVKDREIDKVVVDYHDSTPVRWRYLADVWINHLESEKS